MVNIKVPSIEPWGTPPGDRNRVVNIYDTKASANYEGNQFSIMPLRPTRDSTKK